MKRFLLLFSLVASFLSMEKLSAQCHPQITNMAITQPGEPDPINASKCKYIFNLSFDVITNGGFKYFYFHSWLKDDYPAQPIFNCNSTSSQNPGTSAQLGTAVDDVGKSFLDLGFLGLNNVTFPANTLVEVTDNIATTYVNDPTVILTDTSNSPGLQAFITRKGNSDTLHFDISKLTVIINAPCGSQILARTDVWGSNMNPPAPKAQCYLCDVKFSFNDPSIALIKICDVPYKYSVGITSTATDPIHITYKVYMHDMAAGSFPVSNDVLIHTSSVLPLDNSHPYSSLNNVLPNPYCCVDPWSQYAMYVKLTAQEFDNVFQSQIAVNECAALPIKLKTFTAVRNNDDVTLKWETEGEDNNKGFYVQRKVGTMEWQTIGFVNTKAINGNSSVALAYDFKEQNFVKGITEYRLKQTDINGKSAASQVRSVRGKEQKSMIIVYPNPSSNGKVNIVFEETEGTRDVSLQDINGRVVKQWKGITNNTLQVENLNPGFYTVRIINNYNGEQTVEKIVVKNR